MKALLGYLLLVLIHINAAGNNSVQTALERASSTQITTVEPSPFSHDTLESVYAKLQLRFQVDTGSFPCKNGSLLNVHSSSQNKEQFEVSLDNIKGGYQMQRVQSASGAVRLENDNGEIVLLQLANKTMLLDLKHGNTLINDCQSAAQRSFAEAMTNDPNVQSILE